MAQKNTSTNQTRTKREGRTMKPTCEATQYPVIRRALDRVRTITLVPGESRTQTVFGNETDVNAIMARFTRTGVLPPGRTDPQYADVTELQRDMTETLEIGKIAQAKYTDLQEQIKQRQTEIKKQKDEELKKLRSANTEPKVTAEPT